MLDIIAEFFLDASRVKFIVPFVILGYIWLDKRVFYQAICLLLISVIFNFALKSSFQIPLSPALGKDGFAFPSGHMQSSFVLYGWLIFNTRNILYRALMLVVLIGIAITMVNAGYHNYYDEVGAVFFGSALMIAYYFLLQNKRINVSAALMIVATAMLLYTHAVYKVKPHLFGVYYALAGLLISERLFAQRQPSSGILNNVLSSIICFGSMYAVDSIFAIAAGLPAFVYKLQWVVIGFVMPFSKVAPGMIRARL